MGETRPPRGRRREPACTPGPRRRVGAQRAGVARPSTTVGRGSRGAGSRPGRRPARGCRAGRPQEACRHHCRERLQDHRTHAPCCGVGKPPGGRGRGRGMGARASAGGTTDPCGGRGIDRGRLRGALRRAAVCRARVGDGGRCVARVAERPPGRRRVHARRRGGGRTAVRADERLRPGLPPIGGRGRRARALRSAGGGVDRDGLAGRAQVARRARVAHARGDRLHAADDRLHLRDAVARRSGREPCGGTGGLGDSGRGARRARPGRGRAGGRRTRARRGGCARGVLGIGRGMARVVAACGGAARSVGDGRIGRVCIACRRRVGLLAEGDARACPDLWGVRVRRGVRARDRTAPRGWAIARSTGRGAGRRDPRARRRARRARGRRAGPAVHARGAGARRSARARCGGRHAPAFRPLRRYRRTARPCSAPDGLCARGLVRQAVRGHRRGRGARRRRRDPRARSRRPAERGPLDVARGLAERPRAGRRDQRGERRARCLGAGIPGTPDGRRRERRARAAGLGGGARRPGRAQGRASRECRGRLARGAGSAAARVGVRERR